MGVEEGEEASAIAGVVEGAEGAEEGVATVVCFVETFYRRPWLTNRF